MLAFRGQGGSRTVYMGGRSTMHSRMLRHRFVTGAITLTLAFGGVAVTAGAASAADSGDRAASAQCQQARKDLAAAKKKLRAAKRADKPVKIRKAKKRVAAAKERKAAACAAPTEQSVLGQVQRGQLALSTVDTSPLQAMLPPEIAAGIAGILSKLQTSLDTIGAQVPGADAATLEALSAAVTNMDPEGVVKAIQKLTGALLASGASPASINTLVQMLTMPGDLPTGDLPIPGISELKGMLDQFVAGLPLLAGADFTDPAAAAEALGQIKASFAAITSSIKGPSADWLGALTELTDQLGGLGLIQPGAIGSGDALADVLTGLLGLAGDSTDPLGALTGVLGNGSLGGVLGLLGLPVGGLLGMLG